MDGMGLEPRGGKVVSLRLPEDVAVQVADSRPSGLSQNAWLLSLLRLGLEQVGEVVEQPRTVLAAVPDPVHPALTGVVAPPDDVSPAVVADAVARTPLVSQLPPEVPAAQAIADHRHRADKVPADTYYVNGQRMVRFKCVDCGQLLAPRPHS